MKVLTVSVCSLYKKTAVIASRCRERKLIRDLAMIRGHQLNSDPLRLKTNISATDFECTNFGHDYEAKLPQTRLLSADYLLLLLFPVLRVFCLRDNFLLCWCECSSASKRSIRRFVITEKAPTRAFSWLKAATTALTYKTLLRHYAKQMLTHNN